MILSASRRTDIPCFYSEWFVDRLRAGYVLTTNPMNPHQVSRIYLTPEKIDCIVFWTKDPANILEKLPVIDALGYQYYFQFTLTPYGKELETNLRDKKEMIATFQKLSVRIGREKVLWRYDPIIINDTLTIDYHLTHYRKLCQELQEYTDICTISFVDGYRKLNKMIHNKLLYEISEAQMYQIAAAFSGIAKEYGIELRACCEQLDFSKDGILPAACIDRQIVERITGHSIPVKKDKNQRAGCGCLQSVDIGVYNTCRNGCVYCYANYSQGTVERNIRMHNPNSELLIGTIATNSIIKDRN